MSTSRVVETEEVVTFAGRNDMASTHTAVQMCRIATKFHVNFCSGNSSTINDYGRNNSTTDIGSEPLYDYRPNSLLKDFVTAVIISAPVARWPQQHANVLS